MDRFRITQPLPNVYHILDCGNVCFTLICGSTDTLLFDTGMGFHDVAACVAPYVHGKLHVVLSHAHYDHVYGQQYFSESFVHPDDLSHCRKSVSKPERLEKLKHLIARGILEEDYASTSFLNGTPETVLPLQQMSMDLGDLHIQFIAIPGHTKGSIVAYIEEMKLLLSGDTWNPHTWLFFPESQSLSSYTKHIQKLINLPAEHVLRSHDIQMVTMQQFRAYMHGLNDETFQNAKPCSIPPYTHINTYFCYPEPKSKLVFNNDKQM